MLDNVQWHAVGYSWHADEIAINPMQFPSGYDRTPLKENGRNGGSDKEGTRNSGMTGERPALCQDQRRAYEASKTLSS